MLTNLDVEMRPADAVDGYVNPTCKAGPSGGDPVTRVEAFSVYLPTQATSTMDFGLLVDISGRDRCIEVITIRRDGESFFKCQT